MSISDLGHFTVFLVTDYGSESRIIRGAFRQLSLVDGYLQFPIFPKSIFESQISKSFLKNFKSIAFNHLQPFRVQKT
jgi:hypothetical protein